MQLALQLWREEKVLVMMLVLPYLKAQNSYGVM